MTQPFRHSTHYESGVWSGVTAELLDGDRIVVSAPTELRTVSSAVHLGGFAAAGTVVNWMVPVPYECEDPASDASGRLGKWGYDPNRTVCLMTAAKLTHVSVAEEEGDCFKVVCFTTSGTSNSARAGLVRETFSAYTPGTINTIVLIEGRMTDAALINAVIQASEAKAAALQDLNIIDPESGLTATGTTTDAIVIGVSGQGYGNAVHAYAGAATTIGNAIGRLVYETVYESSRTQHEK
ncbi:adenosylcobinamide amidohydrolase [Paenibacillus gorillae]|uniref:adenosylcobinamide amidohydrolase n=1 Tax=Paenibacillus gorillae TaxID=1243662 RepID=UPI0004B4509B|nr:adenosylcobinamide amidohydrolase [Paenibacillus gorillae]